MTRTEDILDDYTGELRRLLMKDWQMEIEFEQVVLKWLERTGLKRKVHEQILNELRMFSKDEGRDVVGMVRE